MTRRNTAIPLAALVRELDSLGFSLPEKALEDLGSYLSLLMKWNKAMNLVGTRTWEATLRTLVVDSFHLADFLARLPLPPAPATLDLGAGAGLPGIPLRLVWKKGSYTLVEAREKRALFMRTSLSALALLDTSVFHGRAEDFFAASGPADLIISRAFMPWKELLAFIPDALVPGGHVVFLTLAPAPEDIPAPWKLISQAVYSVDKTDRHLWCFTKETV